MYSLPGFREEIKYPTSYECFFFYQESDFFIFSLLHVLPVFIFFQRGADFSPQLQESASIWLYRVFFYVLVTWL